jgi:ATP/ADP translocase
MAFNPSSVFYEKWLVYLSVICVLALLLDRYVQSSRGNKAKENADDRLESGKQGASAAALSALTRKYLVVYAIVMGNVACYNVSMNPCC